MSMLASSTREKVLLVGGGGFLGTILLERLHSNYDIVCLDRGTRYGTFAGVPAPVRLVRGTTDDLASLFREEHFDHLLYLAGGNAARLQGAAGEAEFYGARRSLDATLHFLLAKGNGTAMTYFSSYLCYASCGQVLTENSAKSDSRYAQLHRMNEESLRASGVLHAVVRLSTVYGRYGLTGELQRGGVLGKFIALVAQGGPIRLNNGGQDAMDFLHQEDFVTACQKRLRNPTALGAYNVGSGVLTSLAQLAKILDDALFTAAGRRAEMMHVKTGQTASPQYRHCATEKFEKGFGWKATHSLEEEVPRLLVEELRRYAQIQS
jgi:nucleoside-diphosphate-sugar epimerase